MSDCIFCKIAAGEIPSTALYEDDKVKVIFDAGPATLGHALVLPKTHAANVFEIDDETLAHAHIVTKKVATALKEATVAIMCPTMTLVAGCFSAFSADNYPKLRILKSLLASLC